MVAERGCPLRGHLTGFSGSSVLLLHSVLRKGRRGRDALPQNSHQNRIEFLAEVRNRAMDPLDNFKDPAQWFDHVVFMNDVMFCAKDIKCAPRSSDASCESDCYGFRVGDRSRPPTSLSRTVARTKDYTCSARTCGIFPSFKGLFLSPRAKP